MRDMEDFIRDQRAKALRDLREGTTMDDDEIEREVERQMNDLREGYMEAEE